MATAALISPPARTASAWGSCQAALPAAPMLAAAVTLGDLAALMMAALVDQAAVLAALVDQAAVLAPLPPKPSTQVQDLTFPVTFKSWWPLRNSGAE